MNLKTLIHISTSARGKLSLYFNSKEDLTQEVTDLVKSFEDSSEPLTPVNSIVDFLLEKSVSNDFAREVKQIKKDKFENPEKQEIFDKITRSHKMTTSPFYVELTKEEMYQIFSLQSWREIQLNKICN